MLKDLFRLAKNRRQAGPESQPYEYCPRCDANLTLQKGYRNDLPYWVCKGCGEMLINPLVDSDIAWICDRCEAMLNVQPGFHEDCGEWICAECGFVNKIDQRNLYDSEEEYRSDCLNPYKGLSDKAVLELSCYEEVRPVDSRQDVVLVKDRGTNKLYIRKYLTTFQKSIYEYLLAHPIPHMPKILSLYESDTCLIVTEDYIEGRTLAERLSEALFSQEEAISIAKDVCRILNSLHTLPAPIIHRDIKPSNIILCKNHEVCLLDMNVAKWYDAEQSDDTAYMGTRNFAAPEQVGFGLSASSAKSDIYAVGMLINVMLTGDYPKQKRPSGKIWEIIERCISLEAEKRYTASELIVALEALSR